MQKDIKRQIKVDKKYLAHDFNSFFSCQIWNW